MENIAQAKARNYDLAIDCLATLHTQASQLVGTFVRNGVTLSKSGRIEVESLMTTLRYMADATGVDLAGAQDVACNDGPDAARAVRALTALNDRLLRMMTVLMVRGTKTGAATRQLFLDEAFDRHEVRQVYALLTALVSALGLKVTQ